MKGKKKREEKAQREKGKEITNEGRKEGIDLNPSY
jgi:hypothetical protein